MDLAPVMILLILLSKIVFALPPAIRCPQSEPVQGVDVSGHNPNVSFEYLFKAGKRFTFIKATEGITYINPEFQPDSKEVKDAGLIKGTYHFFLPQDSAEDQAHFFLKTVGNIPKEDLPPVLDMEVLGGQPKQIIIARALKWLEIVELTTGKIPMIYTSLGFWNSLDNPLQFKHYPLFIANYNVHCPEVPTTWSNWTFWQFMIGDITVYKQQIDFDEFNGTLSEMKDFIIKNMKDAKARRSNILSLLNF
jgi:lysozyme